MEKKRLIEMEKEYSIQALLKGGGKMLIGIIVICLLLFLGTNNLEITLFAFAVLAACWAASNLRLFWTHYQVKRRLREEEHK